jgi:uncharacterized protein (PEP-CTERM system associated)
MVIIMLGMISAKKVHFHIRYLKILALMPLCHLSALSVAGELEIETSVEAKIYVYETKEEQTTSKNNQAIVVMPSILTSYSSKRLLTSFIAKHTKVERKIDVEGADKNHTDYKFNGILAVVPNTLNITIIGQQGYKVVDQQQEFIADNVLTDDNLTKFNNNSGSIGFTIPNPKYFGLTIQSTYSQTKTEESIDADDGLKSDNTLTLVQLNQGKNARNYSFSFAARYNDTSRTNFEDFRTSQARGLVGLSITQNMSLVLTGNIEKYDFNQESFSEETNLDSNSYGAGIKWQPRNARALTITYNQRQEDNETKFLGINIDWAFSSRTILKFDHSKKHYGDAYSLDFGHAVKAVRSSIRYREQVTTFSRPESTSNPIGLFVCQFGSTELTDCFQPDNTNYQLQAGEEFRSLSEMGYDISQDIIFTKSGSFNLSYQKRRIKASIDASYRKTESLESDSVRTNRNVRLNLSYTLSKKANFNLSTTLARNLYDNNVTPDNIINANLDFKRTLSRNLELSIGIGIVYRNSVVQERDIKNRRLTIGMNYEL